MKHLTDEQFKQTFQTSALQKQWAKSEAERFFDQVFSQLDRSLQDESRVGTLSVKPVAQTDEPLHWWVDPIDKGKINGFLLGPHSIVKIVDETVCVVFEGAWKDVDLALLCEEKKLLVRIEPPERKQAPKQSWTVKKSVWVRLRDWFRSKTSIL